MKPSSTHRFSFLQDTGLCFVLLTLVLVWRHGMSPDLPDTWLIRAGMLRDLAAELPIGRQALVCSPFMMPLAGVAALPFLPFLPPAGYGYAYLYGLAALLAMAVVPLRSLLRQWGSGRLSGAAPLLLALAAAALGPTRHSELLACLAMLILALYFEHRDLAELRALAGVFWGLVLFAHVAGLALVALRIVVAGVCAARQSLARGPGRAGATVVTQATGAETKAVRWIQGVSVAYLLVVYLFLNWMIMGTLRYPVASAARLCTFARSQAPAEPLADALARLCPDRTPVVSGHWGYLIKPLLRKTSGYHLIDFHPAKLPAWDTRPLVLVVPALGNPLARLSDLPPDQLIPHPGSVSYLLLAQTPDWRFYLFDSTVGRR